MKPQWTLCSEGVPEPFKMVEVIKEQCRNPVRFKWAERCWMPSDICWRYVDPPAEQVQSCDPCRKELQGLQDRVSDLESTMTKFRIALSKF